MGMNGEKSTVNAPATHKDFSATGLKIALTHFDLTTESGDPKHMLSIARGLKKLGYEVIVYCAEFKAGSCFPRLNSGLDIRVVSPQAPLGSLRGANGIAGKIFERIKRGSLYNDLVKRMLNKMDRDFDLIISENDPSYKIGFFYKKINPKTKIVWIMHNPPFFHSRKSSFIVDILSRVAALFEKSSAKYYGKAVDSILVFDEHAKQLAEEVGPPVKIVMLPIDVEYFYSSAKRNIVGGKKVGFLSLGALSPARRYEDTILAAAILRKKGYDARVVLICKDYWADRSYRAQFEKFIESSGIKQYIDARFSGSTEEELLRVMKASDIFVLPNDIKLWAIGAFEAMAVGSPLIVSRMTAVVEILHDGIDSLFVDPRRPDQIAEKAEALINDRTLYSRISAAGQKLVQEKLNVGSYIREMLSSV